MIFFVSKISCIRTDLFEMETLTENWLCPDLENFLFHSSSKLYCFKPTTVPEISSIIREASKTSCPLDPIPTSLLHDVLPMLVPVITNIVNYTCLTSGVFPSCLKSAIVQPLLKKPSLDNNIIRNFRPVSNLPFLSKVIEKVLAVRLLDHMTASNQMDPMQSAYRKGHRTETALLRVHNDIISAVDKGYGVCLIMLDLSAAFDAVDHTILLTFLKEGKTLDVFTSYISLVEQNVFLLREF